MADEFRIVPADMLLLDVEELMASHGDHAVVVTKEDGSLFGILTVTDLRRGALEYQETPTAGDLATTDIVVALEGQFLADALAQRGAEFLRQLPVVKERNGVRYPIGLLRRNDVLTAYLRLREQRASMDGSQKTAANDEVATIDTVVERESHANGLTLAEMRLPRGVVVTVVEREGNLLVPSGQTRLRTGDRVRLFGDRVALTSALALLDVPEVLPVRRNTKSVPENLDRPLPRH